MKIHTEFITLPQEAGIAFIIEEEIKALPKSKHGGRSRILRMGWDYSNPKKWIGSVPGSIPSWAPSLGNGEDSITINQYLRGQAIAPHIDSKAFGDVAILSLLADVTMRFTSPAGETCEFLLPRRSMAVMSGGLRKAWKHETLPLEEEIRYSVVYRKRLI